MRIRGFIQSPPPINTELSLNKLSVGQGATSVVSGIIGAVIAVSIFGDAALDGHFIQNRLAYGYAVHTIQGSSGSILCLGAADGSFGVLQWNGSAFIEREAISNECLIE